MLATAIPSLAVAPAVSEAPDVSPEAIAALVAQGAAALQLPSDLRSTESAHDVSQIGAPDALALLVGVTHDMRSPLSSILVLVERLRAGQAGPLTPAQERLLSLVYGAAFGLATMTNNTLDFARGSSSSGTGTPVAFSITDLLRSVRQVVQPIAEEKGLVLRCSGPTADRRLGQPVVLHRVLLNLTTNALKFTDNGAVTITATALGASALCFEVADTGRGMPSEVAAHVAAPVWAGPFSSGAFSGAGLGLGMCRRLLGDLGSDLQISSLQPTGTRAQFTLDLPAP